MPVVDVCESWESDCGWQHTGEPGSGSSTARRKFTVTFTLGTTLPDVLLDNRIPQQGSPHPGNTFFRCRGSNAKQTGPVSAEVESIYGLPVSLTDDDAGDGPLSRPPIIRFSTIKTEAPIDEDINGEAIVTANGERFEGVTKPFSDTAITITRNLATFNFFAIDAFTDTVNSDSFLGFPAGRLRIDSIDATQTSEGSLVYWQVTAVMHGRRPINTTNARAWWKRIRHEGYRVKEDAPSDKIVNATDDNLDLVSKPVLLDANGRKVTNPANAIWLEWQVHELTSFNNLGLI